MLLAREGQLWRARFERGALQPPRALIDLRGETFRRVVPPLEAKRW